VVCGDWTISRVAWRVERSRRGAFSEMAAGAPAGGRNGFANCKVAGMFSKPSDTAERASPAPSGANVNHATHEISGREQADGRNVPNMFLTLTTKLGTSTKKLGKITTIENSPIPGDIPIIKHLY